MEWPICKYIVDVSPQWNGRYVNILFTFIPRFKIPVGPTYNAHNVCIRYHIPACIHFTCMYRGVRETNYQSQILAELGKFTVFHLVFELFKSSCVSFL